MKIKPQKNQGKEQTQHGRKFHSHPLMRPKRSQMNTNNSFEVSILDGRVWVRPYAGIVEFNGETYATREEAVASIPATARALGWTDYIITVDE